MRFLRSNKGNKKTFAMELNVSAEVFSVLLSVMESSIPHSLYFHFCKESMMVLKLRQGCHFFEDSSTQNPTFVQSCDD